jgi:hypothetical protein
VVGGGWWLVVGGGWWLVVGVVLWCGVVLSNVLSNGVDTLFHISFSFHPQKNHGLQHST